MNLSAVYPSGELHEVVESRRLCPPGAERPSPNMLGPMNEPTATADLLKSDLARHTPVMAHHRHEPVFAGPIGRHITIWRRFGGGLAAISGLQFHRST